MLSCRIFSVRCKYALRVLMGQISSSGVKHENLMHGPEFPGRLVFICSNSENVQELSVRVIPDMSSIWIDWPRWAVTKDSSITSLRVSSFSEICWFGLRVLRYLRTLLTSHTELYFGTGFLFKNTSFKYLDTTGCVPNVFAPSMVRMVDNADRAVLIAE